MSKTAIGIQSSGSGSPPRANISTAITLNCTTSDVANCGFALEENENLTTIYASKRHIEITHNGYTATFKTAVKLIHS